MKCHVSWHVELAIQPGRFEDFEKLTEEMVEFTRRERGVLCYERFTSEDRRIVHIYERYVDSSAAIDHLNAFIRKFGDRFSELVDRKQFNVFGAPSAELKSMLESFGGTTFFLLAGFCDESRL